VHFLHIGKCAGTAIKDLAERINSLPNGPRILAHGHSKKLNDLPSDADYFFSVRHPVSRFVSAFCMRKRKEQPRLYREWTAGEKEAFERFPEANDLAESLFAPSAAGQAAFAAMQSIGHMSFQHGWFKVRDIFAARPPLCVLRQEKLAHDVAHLLRLLDVDPRVGLPDDSTRAHRNDYSLTPPLSVKAIENLEAWYAVDIAYYRLIDAWVEDNQNRKSPTFGKQAA
jgi:hypothetical protein